MKKRKSELQNIFEIDYLVQGWPGVIKLAEAMGKTSTDVGDLMNDVWGDKTNVNQLLLCSAVHYFKSKKMLKMYKKPRLKLAPKGTETDIHYAIRMNHKKIRDIYSKVGKAKDIYKAVTQLYKKIMATRRRAWVLSIIPKEYR